MMRKSRGKELIHSWEEGRRETKKEQTEAAALATPWVSPRVLRLVTRQPEIFT